MMSGKKTITRIIFIIAMLTAICICSSCVFSTQPYSTPESIEPSPESPTASFPGNDASTEPPSPPDESETPPPLAETPDIPTPSNEYGFFSTNYANISYSQWDSIEKEYIRYQDADAFLMEVDAYVDEILEYASPQKQMTGMISFSFVSGVSYTSGRHIYLNKNAFECDLAPIAHEVTHALFPNNRSTSLSEGFASYCQDFFGRNPAPHNFSLDVDSCANALLEHETEDFEKLFPDIGAAGKRDTFGYGELRDWFYMLSNSFVKYLISTYGVENFMTVYASADIYNEYEESFGLSFEELKVAWRESIENYPAPVSLVDLTSNMREVLIRHNYPIE